MHFLKIKLNLQVPRMLWIPGKSLPVRQEASSNFQSTPKAIVHLFVYRQQVLARIFIKKIFFFFRSHEISEFIYFILTPDRWILFFCWKCKTRVYWKEKEGKCLSSISGLWTGGKNRTNKMKMNEVLWVFIKRKERKKFFLCQRIIKKCLKFFSFSFGIFLCRHSRPYLHNDTK